MFQKLKTGNYIFISAAIIVFSAVSVSLDAQSLSIDSVLKNHEAVSIEKLYIQTDREFYSLGDTIWYKAYSVDGLSNKPFLSEHNLLVELISEAGNVMIRQNHLLMKGYACGYIQIPDSISPGSYFIRGFTPILERLGENSYFWKMVKIEKIMNSFEQQAAYGDTLKPSVYDIAFLPEGGTMVYNVLNRIAFKSVTQKGKGIDISGGVFDEEGNQVAEFSTVYQGMGQFSFVPLTGHRYSVRIKDNPQFKYVFDDIKKDGYVLHAERSDSSDVIITVSRNTDDTVPRKLFLTAMFRDEFIFYLKVDLVSDSRSMRIDKSLFPAGIIKLTLLNDESEPLAERLIFRDKKESRLPVAIKMDKTEYCSREKAILNLDTGIADPDSGFCSMAVSVVNTAYINSNGLSQDILSYLLLDSELKGAIESPSAFFNDDGGLKSAEKLDLLMLTQGWRKYLWDEYHSVKPDYDNIENITGISLSGNVERLIGKKPVKGGEVMLMIFDNIVSIIELKTDKEGRFSTGPLYISDSTNIIVQAKNEKDKKYTEIFLDTVKYDKQVSVETIRQNLMEPDIPLKFYRYNYYRSHAEKLYNQKTGILLEPVIITGKKPERETESRIYSVADNTLKIREQDYSYPDILSYLQGRVPGVNVEGDNVTIRGYSSFSSGGGAFVMVDGIPYGNDERAIEMLKSIPMSVIDRIDILKNISNLALFGSRGSGGVIAVYTKRGEIGVPDPYVFGLITSKIKGYQKMRRFYSPVYDPSKPFSEKPDYRPCLLWNPIISTDKSGKSQIEFFTSDELSDYVVILEGITSDGRMIFSTTEFVVNTINPVMSKQVR